MEKSKKKRKIKPYGKTWEREANNLARSWMQIKPCKDCNHPVINGYCCSYCGSVNP
jgi:hypothetical protein